MKPFGPSVIGFDIGGTSTTAVIATRDGVIATATGPGSNPVSTGYDSAVRTWHAVLGDVLSLATGEFGRAPEVELCVIGGAGVGALADEPVDLLAQLQAASTSRRPPVFTSDVAIAFASSSESPTGLVIVSGTGAVAGRMRDYDLAEFVDGNGWFVGDAGSGHWIGVETAKAVLATFQYGPATRLRQLIVANAGLEDSWWSVIRWVYDLPPRGLAALVPHVRDAAAAGDAVANDILDRAADELVSSLARISPSADDGIVVLGGSIARSSDLLFERLRDRIDARWGIPVLAGGDGAFGATRVAWRMLDGEDTP
jgi:N-acetylglucosamine kinase-like BadF-type ATPase